MKKQTSVYMVCADGPIGLNTYGTFFSKEKAEKVRDEKNKKIKFSFDEVGVWEIKVEE